MADGSHGARRAADPVPADRFPLTGPHPSNGTCMAILLDGSAVLAAADRADLNHEAAVAWFARVDEPLPSAP